MDPSKKSANQLTIESANLEPSILYLDFLHDKIITSLLEALTKDTCNAFLLDENIAPAEIKKTREKVALVLNKDIVLAGKKRILEKRKVQPNKNRRNTKKTPSVVGLEFNKTKSNSVEGPSSEILNTDSIFKLASELSSMDNEAVSSSGNKKGKKQIMSQ